MYVLHGRAEPSQGLQCLGHLHHVPGWQRAFNAALVLYLAQMCLGARLIVARSRTIFFPLRAICLGRDGQWPTLDEVVQVLESEREHS